MRIYLLPFSWFASYTLAMIATPTAEMPAAGTTASCEQLPFNAETLAAFEEGDAMLRGELPAKRFDSLDEMLSDLDSDD